MCGLPAVLSSDHGADFTSTHICQVCADLRVQLIHATRGQPPRAWESRTNVRDDHDRVAADPARAYPARQPGPADHPTGPDPVRAGHRGRPVHRGYLPPSDPPGNRAGSGRPLGGGDWLPRIPDSLEDLDLLLLTVSTPRKVQRDGIHCHGLRYFSVTLAPYVGEPVTIRYDPRDLAEVRVYRRGEFLCRAVSPEIASVTVSLQDLQAARNQRRRELRQQLTARRSLVELLNQPGPSTPEHPTRSAKNKPVDERTPRRGRRLKLYREE